mmetsp:Transcript_17983/g.41991  ORF Transcript_17983/g.41991 Transcript_17983/m.41991 type:complete len:1150 (+) Transcript_17983:115-3564(+)
MGGGSSYLAILRITLFFIAIWSVGKVARQFKVSTIVFEIIVGLILSPSLIGLMPPPYAECQHRGDYKCKTWEIEEAIVQGPDEHVYQMLHHHAYCLHERQQWEAFSFNAKSRRLLFGETRSRRLSVPRRLTHGGHGEDGNHETTEHAHATTLAATTHEGHGGSEHEHEATTTQAAATEGHEGGEHEEGEEGEEGEAEGEEGPEGELEGEEEEGIEYDGEHLVEETYFNHTLCHAEIVPEELEPACHAFEILVECTEKKCEEHVNSLCIQEPNIFTLTGHAGVSLMIFESGMHFDFEKARKVGPKACAVALLGTCLPIIAGMLMTAAFGEAMYPDGLAVGVALAPTSVGIALKLLLEAKQLQKDFGQAIITAAFVDDILSLVAFNVLFAVTSGEFSILDVVIKPIIGIIFMCVGAMMGLKLWPGVVENFLARIPPKQLPGGMSRQDEALLLLMFTLLLSYATFTWWLGTHLWGCFVAGMSFAMIHHAHHVWVAQLKRITVWMLRIFFSCTVAFAIPFDELLSITAVWQGGLMGIVACMMTKVFCAFFMGEARWVIGWAMVGRAEFAYLIAEMAKSSGTINDKTFSLIIWALLWATIFAPFCFRRVLQNYAAMLAAREEEEPTRSLSMSGGIQLTTSSSHGNLDMIHKEASIPFMSTGVGHSTQGGVKWLPCQLTGLRFQIVYPKTSPACSPDDLKETFKLLNQNGLIVTAMEQKCDQKHHFSMFRVQPHDGKPLEASQLEFIQEELFRQLTGIGAHIVFLPPSYALQSPCKLAIIRVFANLQDYPLVYDGTGAVKVVTDIVKQVTHRELCIMRAGLEMHGTTCMITVLIGHVDALGADPRSPGREGAQNKLEFGLEHLHEGVSELPDISPQELKEVKKAIENTLHHKVVAIVDPLTHAQGPLGEISHDAPTLLAGQVVDMESVVSFEIRFFTDQMIYDLLLKALELLRRHSIGLLAARVDERADCKVNLVILAREIAFTDDKQDKLMDDLADMCIKQLGATGHIDLANITEPMEKKMRFLGDSQFSQPADKVLDAYEMSNYSIPEKKPLVTTSEYTGQPQVIGNGSYDQQTGGTSSSPAVPATQGRVVPCFAPILPCRGVRTSQQQPASSSDGGGNGNGQSSSTPGCRPCIPTRPCVPSSTSWRTQRGGQ